MDPRLKKILDDRAEADKILNAKLKDETKEKEVVAAELLAKQTTLANEWIEKNLFDIIAYEVNSGRDRVEFSDHHFSSQYPPRKDIPAYLLAKAAGKIDGLHVVTRFINELDDRDGPGYPAHHEYHIRWSPEPANQHR